MSLCGQPVNCVEALHARINLSSPRPRPLSLQFLICIAPVSTLAHRVPFQCGIAAGARGIISGGAKEDAINAIASLALQVQTQMQPKHNMCAAQHNLHCKLKRRRT